MLALSPLLANDRLIQGWFLMRWWMLKDVLVVCSVTSCSSLVMRPKYPKRKLTWPKPPECLCDICPCHFHQKDRAAAIGILGVSFSLFHSLFIGEVGIEGLSCFFGRDIDQIYVFSTERVLCPAVSSRRESSEYLSHISQVKPCVQWPLTFPFASLSFIPSLCMGISGLPWWHRWGVWGHLTPWPVLNFRGSGYQEGLSHKNDRQSWYLNNSSIILLHF